MISQLLLFLGNRGKRKENTGFGIKSKYQNALKWKRVEVLQIVGRFETVLQQILVLRGHDFQYFSWISDRIDDVIKSSIDHHHNTSTDLWHPQGLCTHYTSRATPIWNTKHA